MGGEYTIAGGLADARRLARQARVMEAATAAFLARAGLAAGAVSLDVGCGDGQVTIAMARLARPRGLAVGVDVDAGALAIARQAAARAGVRARFVRADAARLGAAGAFDLVYARLVLSHLIDPCAALRAMCAAVRPGGAVAVEDLNLGTLRSEPPAPTLDALQAIYGQTVRLHGGDPTIGVAQLLDRIEDRFALLTGGDRLAADRQRSLAATVEWSYRLLDDDERRVLRAVSVFPAGFTLEGAEAVAGPAAGPVVLRLVDCSLLVPPREGPDGRSRYAMLETLRAYAAGLLAETGEHEEAAAALAGYALRVSRQAAAGLWTATGEAPAARWLDAEDATMRQALAWAMEHDPALALRLANTLGSWWLLRGRLAGEYPLLCRAAGYAEAGSDGWCTAQLWLGTTAQYSADPAAALGHYTAVRDAAAGQPPSPALTAALAGRASILRLTGRAAEAAGDARYALALARQIGDPAGELSALVQLSLDADYADDHDEAIRLARQAGQITAGIPGPLARMCSWVLTVVLAGAGDLAEAGRAGAAGLARARDAGDLFNQVHLLPRIADLDLRAGRTGDAAAHLREGLRLAVRTGDWFGLLPCISQCGDLCAATGRAAEALTLWAACVAVDQRAPQPTFPPWFVPHREEPRRQARQALGPGRARAAEDRGAAMSLATAAEYALMLTDPGPPQRAAPGSGQLSARERELVTLIAQGRTNAQIAAQLYISIRTVSSHLDRIRDKTGCRRRADLTRLALSAGLV